MSLVLPCSYPCASLSIRGQFSFSGKQNWPQTLGSSDLLGFLLRPLLWRTLPLPLQLHRASQPCRLVVSPQIDLALVGSLRANSGRVAERLMATDCKSVA